MKNAPAHTEPQTIQPIDSKDVLNVNSVPSEQCPTCGRYPHVIPAVRLLDPAMESAFPIPDDITSNQKESKTKRRIICTARHMTSKEMMQQVRDKEEKYLPKSTKTSTSPQNTEPSTSSEIGINECNYAMC